MPEIDEQVHLSPYRDDWPALFTTEQSRLALLLGLSTEAFEHIGSTAVPGLIAKPIIDIMLGLLNNIALRNFLRSDPVARERYMEAKLAALAAGSNTLLPYSRLKGPVIEALLRQALSIDT